MSTDVKSVVLSHISACAQDDNGAPWCCTHEAMMRGPECLVMLDALDLAEAVADAVRSKA